MRQICNVHSDSLDGDVVSEQYPAGASSSEETWMSKLEVQQLRQIQKAASAITMLSNPESRAGAVLIHPSIYSLHCWCTSAGVTNNPQ